MNRRALFAAAAGCAALSLAALAGCGGVQSAALDCWGAGAAEGAPCVEAKSAELSALVLGASSLPAVFFADAGARPACGAVVGCESAEPSAALTAASVPAKSTPAGPTSQVANNTPPPPETPAAAPSLASAAPPAVAVPAAAAPAPPPDERLASAGADPCRGIAIDGLQNKSSLAAAELNCLRDTLTGKRQATDPEVQVAALAMFNTRSSGWPKSVDFALKRSGLKNSPLLNFAGIKPAYDKGRYGTVLSRSKRVWKNLGKGYQLSSTDRGFLLEFACRSAGQLALGGKPPNDGLDWCERWLDHAERAGQSTTVALDLIDKLE
jgi:hypothetical protein